MERLISSQMDTLNRLNDQLTKFRRDTDVLRIEPHDDKTIHASHLRLKELGTSIIDTGHAPSYSNPRSPRPTKPSTSKIQKVPCLIKLHTTMYSVLLTSIRARQQLLRRHQAFLHQESPRLARPTTLRPRSSKCKHQRGRILPRPLSWVPMPKQTSLVWVLRRD